MVAVLKPRRLTPRRRLSGLARCGGVTACFVSVQTRALRNGRWDRCLCVTLYVLVGPVGTSLRRRRVSFMRTVF